MVGMANVGGINATVRAFGRYESTVRKQITNALTVSSILVSRDAKRVAPLKFGNLKRSIRFVVDRRKLVAAVGSNLDYSIYQELGTKKMRANPYLQPALEKNQRQIIKLLKKALEVRRV